MAVILSRLTGTNRISEEYGLLNDNAETIEQAFDNVDTAVETAQQAGDDAQDSIDTHAANDTRHWTVADRNKMNGIEAGAEVNAVQSVAGKVGVIELDADDISETAARKIMTSAERTKLEGIASDAEANQDAFAQIRVAGQGDVFANVASALLTLIADVGITISTDPVNRTITFTATGESAPAAHGSTHLPGGADPIAYATSVLGGLMPALDKAKLDAIPSGPPWTWADLEG